MSKNSQVIEIAKIKTELSHIKKELCSIKDEQKKLSLTVPPYGVHNMILLSKGDIKWLQAKH